MVTLRFIDTYRSVMWPAIVASLRLPLKMDCSSTKIQKLLSALHVAVVVVFLLWKLKCGIYCYFVNEFVDSIFSEAVLLAILSGLVFIYFYIARSDDVKNMIQSLDEISSIILNSDLGNIETFISTYIKDANSLRNLSLVFYISSVICPAMFTILGPIQAYVDGEYGRLPVPASCDFEQGFGVGLYELLTFAQFLSLCLPAFLKLGNEFVLFRFIRIHVAIFRYLRESIATIGNKINDSKPTEFNRDFEQWIKIHQYSIRTITKLFSLYSPLIVLYYVVLISFIVTMLFYQLNVTHMSFVQTSSLCGYMVITVVQFYILCHLADEVLEEAQRISVGVYFIPWYNLNKKAKDSLRYVISMANRPIILTAYKAPSFEVNRAAFQAFMMSVLSTYMGLRTLMERQ